MRAQIALEPVLAYAREIAAQVESIEDARALEQRLRERYSVPMLASMLLPVAYSIRSHVDLQWMVADTARRDAATDSWATRTARSVSRLFGSLRRGAVQALRAATASVAETVQGWAENGLPTRHGTLEQRFAEELEQRTHEVSQRWHAERARGAAARWRWRTQRDARVRRKHRALEGETFAPDEQPSEGRPGEPYGCRCWAEWILPRK
jgi:SPP1 gp7 family putative phage head morphogenesis protein